jgi:hypothetical protein
LFDGMSPSAPGLRAGLLLLLPLLMFALLGLGTRLR